MNALLPLITVVVVAAIVLVLVGFLLGIILALYRGQRSLARLVAGLQAVDGHTAPLASGLGAINQGLTALLEALLGADANLKAILDVAAAQQTRTGSREPSAGRTEQGAA